MPRRFRKRPANRLGAGKNYETLQLLFGVIDRLQLTNRLALVVASLQDGRGSRRPLVLGYVIEEFGFQPVRAGEQRDRTALRGARLIAKPVARCEKNKQQDNGYDNVVLPGCSRIVPQQHPFEARKHILSLPYARSAVFSGYFGAACNRLMSSLISGVSRSAFTTSRAGMSRCLAGTPPFSLSLRDFTAS